MQRNVKRFFNVRHRSADVDQHPIGMRRRHGQPIGARKIEHRLIILSRWTKHFRELLRREIMAVVRTGGIVELCQEILERIRLAKRQSNGQVQLI